MRSFNYPAFHGREINQNHTFLVSTSDGIPFMVLWLVDGDADPVLVVKLTDSHVASPWAHQPEEINVDLAAVYAAGSLEAYAEWVVEEEHKYASAAGRYKNNASGVAAFQHS